MNKWISLFTLPLVLMSQVLLAQDGTPSRDTGIQTIVIVAIGLVFFYLILWRPEQKRRKAVENLRSSLSKGDKVTAMGILGTVSEVKEHTVILKMIDGAKIEFLKAAISEVEPDEEQVKSD